MDKLSENATALTLNDDLEKSDTERLNIFYKYVEVSRCLFSLSYSVSQLVY